MKKYISFFCIIMILGVFRIAAHAENISLKIDEVTCSPGESVSVPISISGNTGIAGAIIDITYDKELTLTDINKGTAFNALTLTLPKYLTSYPLRLLWDGESADISNGAIAVLTFTAPEKAGTFKISASYAKGGIYDGDLNDLDVTIINGSISTETIKPKIIVSGESELNITLVNTETITGTVITALYDSEERLIEVKTYSAKQNITAAFEKANKGKYAKVMWWDSLEHLMPLAEAEKSALK